MPESPRPVSRAVFAAGVACGLAAVSTPIATYLGWRYDEPLGYAVAIAGVLLALGLGILVAVLYEVQR